MHTHVMPIHTPLEDAQVITLGKLVSSQGIPLKSCMPDKCGSITRCAHCWNIYNIKTESLLSTPMIERRWWNWINLTIPSHRAVLKLLTLICVICLWWAWYLWFVNFHDGIVLPDGCCILHRWTYYYNKYKGRVLMQKIVFCKTYTGFKCLLIFDFWRWNIFFYWFNSFPTKKKPSNLPKTCTRIENILLFRS